MKRVEAELSALSPKPEEVITLARRAAETRRELAFLLESEEKSYVYWYERRGRGVFLAATPIDVSEILREKLFERFDTVVLTSATLAVGGRFDYLKQRLGCCRRKEVVLPTEFNFHEQALLYIPRTHARCAPCPPFPRAPPRKSPACSKFPKAGRSACSPAMRRCGTSTSACRDG